MSETVEFKDERKQFARLLKNYASWVSLIESDGGPHTITLPSGQEIHYLDILDGFAILPERQRQAVWLMCVQDLSEAETAKIMGFLNWPTPVQQYKNYGLAKLIAFQKSTPEQRITILQKSKKYNVKGVVAGGQV
jgi:hypothetical protein